mmetsp:Transcript_20826/g.47881  ORF Transcript_20826/g.47881 Transcript_20826/m.47881 type:complete len:81 (+) Transcript_20826:1017-1259(+)
MQRHSPLVIGSEKRSPSCSSSRPKPLLQQQNESQTLCPRRELAACARRAQNVVQEARQLCPLRNLLLHVVAMCTSPRGAA